MDRNRCLRKTAETISQGEGRAQPLPPQMPPFSVPRFVGRMNIYNDLTDPVVR